MGHTASVATVYKHDTALAIASSRGQDIIIPRNINLGTFSTIVWDNNDFDEETVSGKGTTHVANGIMLQNGNTILSDRVTVSKSCHTVQAPETYIAPYNNQEKGTISLRSQSSDISIDDKSHQFNVIKSMSNNLQGMLILCTHYRVSTHLRVGSHFQDGPGSTRKCTKKFELSQTLVTCQ